MNQLLDFLETNYEWIFSGFGVTLVTSFFLFFKRKKLQPEKSNTFNFGEIKPEVSNIISGGNITQINNFNKKTDSDLKLVDITLSDNEFGICYIDIKLRNIGEKVAFIKNVTLEIFDKDQLKDPTTPGYKAIDISGEYNFVLDIHSDKKVIKQNISHAIKPNEVEFIRLTLKNQEPDPSFVLFYHTSLKLFYDEDNKCLEIPSLLISLNSSEFWEIDNDWEGERDIIVKNKSIAKRFNNKDGIKNPYFIRTLADN